MRLKKVISGGQTGADQTGVECAAAMGLVTGGTMPKGFRTEKGSKPDWAKKYGLVEDFSTDYKPRTRRNVADADVTLWFGRTGSPGYYCTMRACRDYGRPFKINPQLEDLAALAEAYEIWNIAGNRKSTNPAVVGLVETAFASLKNYLQET